MDYKKKATIYDIAKELNISSGTVYRALNNKGRFSKKTQQRVLETAERLNYSINQTAQALRRNPVTVGAILCCPVPQFLKEIELGIRAGFADIEAYNVFHDIRVISGYNAEQRPDEIFCALNDFENNGYSSIILFLSGSADKFMDKLNELGEKGVNIVTIVNDIPCKNRIFNVAADGYSAGALAAEFLDLCCPKGKIAILTGNKSTYIHEKNISGFIATAKDSSISEVDVYEHNDEPTLVSLLLKKIFHGEKSYDGVYIATASTITAYPFLKKLSQTHTPKIVTTDLFKENVKLLEARIANASIFQAPYKQGKEAVKKLYKHMTNEFVTENVTIPPILVLRSNMYSFKKSDSD